MTLGTEPECAPLLTNEVAQRLERRADPVTIKTSEVAKRIALEGMQMMGGHGYATEYDMESHVRHSLVLPIYAGSNEIQREIISGSLGLRCPRALAGAHIQRNLRRQDGPGRDVQLAV